jgi:hypothetical protein
MKLHRTFVHCLLGMGLIASLNVGAASPGSNADDPGNEAGYQIATSVAKLAKSDTEVDVQALSRAFQLPELLPSIDRQGALTWSGPFSHLESPRFQAYYRPPRSSLGIEVIGISWEASTKKGDGFLTTLHIVLKRGFCPSEALLATAIGVNARTMPAPGVDGGLSHNLTWLKVDQSHGEPVSIMYTNGNTCDLRISRRRSF